MPVRLRWQDESHTITRLEITGRVSLDELFDVWRTEAQMQREQPHPVYSLNIIENVTPTLMGANVKSMVAFISENKPDNLQLTVQAVPNTAIRRMLSIVAAGMPHRVALVHSVEEALRVIQRDRTPNPTAK
ncbi:MAG: hypothetical protein AAF125_17745 [Chloroflexota bacterium]